MQARLPNTLKSLTGRLCLPQAMSIQPPSKRHRGKPNLDNLFKMESSKPLSKILRAQIILIGIRYQTKKPHFG